MSRLALEDVVLSDGTLIPRAPPFSSLATKSGIQLFAQTRGLSIPIEL
jgi:hypothetical protein